MVAGVSDATAAEGNNRAAVIALSALDGMDARRIGHVLVDDLGHALDPVGAGQQVEVLGEQPGGGSTNAIMGAPLREARDRIRDKSFGAITSIRRLG